MVQCTHRRYCYTETPLGYSETSHLLALTNRVGHYAARGLRSGTAEITAVVLPLRLLAFLFEKRDSEIGHLPGGFKCEFGGGSRVQKKSVSMRKFILQELNAENCVNQRFMQRVPGKIYSVKTRCIVKTSGFTRGVCKNP